MFQSIKTYLALTVVGLMLGACVPAEAVIVSASTGVAPTPVASAFKSMPVAAVQIEIGIGSPIPVDAFISAELPDTCAQLAEVRVERKPFEFQISLESTVSTEAHCFRDTLPFRMDVPLNMVNQPEGLYTVKVNDAITTFRWPSEPTVTPEPIGPAPLPATQIYRGPNPYRATPEFTVQYDPMIWNFVENMDVGREANLVHRSLPNCSVWLKAGPVGAPPLGTVQFAGYEWTLAQLQADILSYSTPHEDLAFIFGVFLPDAYVADVKSPCQQAFEDVLSTFRIVTN